MRPLLLTAAHQADRSSLLITLFGLGFWVIAVFGCGEWLSQIHPALKPAGWTLGFIIGAAIFSAYVATYGWSALSIG